MAPSTVRLTQRAEVIVDELLKHEYVSVEKLAKRFGVSAATIRKDLERLEEKRLLRRVHGGAVMVEPLMYEAFRRRQDFHENEEKHIEEKRRIALAAAQLIADGDTIAFTGGTTATQVARSIRPGRKITVITNALNIVMELSDREGVNIFVPGGFLKGSMFSLTGMNGIRSISEFMIDKVFIGVNGLHVKRGLTTIDVEHAAIHRALIHQAACKICVADHTKFGQLHTALVCPIEEIDYLVTDNAAPEEAIAALESKGIQIIRA